jgi:hypothetical protein
MVIGSANEGNDDAGLTVRIPPNTCRIAALQQTVAMCQLRHYAMQQKAFTRSLRRHALGSMAAQ